MIVKTAFLYLVMNPTNMSAFTIGSMVFSLLDFGSSGIVTDVSDTHITYTSNQTKQSIRLQINQVTNDPNVIIWQLLQENEELRTNYHSANKEIIRMMKANS